MCGDPNVCHRFEATVGDRVVKTQTKRKTEAAAEFATAVQQGHSAVIAKQVFLICSKAPTSLVRLLSMFTALLQS